jgi:DNA-directed RNA polymerase subunit beta'
MWTSANAQLTEHNENIREDQQGFNSVYMMLDSGAHYGSKEQIRQLTSNMRGLVAKPKKIHRWWRNCW